MKKKTIICSAHYYHTALYLELISIKYRVVYELAVCRLHGERIEQKKTECAKTEQKR